MANFPIFLEGGQCQPQMIFLEGNVSIVSVQCIHQDAVVSHHSLVKIELHTNIILSKDNNILRGLDTWRSFHQEVSCIWGHPHITCLGQQQEL